MISAIRCWLSAPSRSAFFSRLPKRAPPLGSWNANTIPSSVIGRPCGRAELHDPAEAEPLAGVGVEHAERRASGQDAAKVREPVASPLARAGRARAGGGSRSPASGGGRSGFGRRARCASPRAPPAGVSESRQRRADSIALAARRKRSATALCSAPSPSWYSAALTCPPSFSRRSTCAVVAKLAAPGLEGAAERRHRGRALGVARAAEARAEAAVDAGGAAGVGLRVDRSRVAMCGWSEPPANGGPLGRVREQQAEVHRHAGRHRVRGAARRSERIVRRSLHAVERLGLDVEGLEVVVAEGPVGEARAGGDRRRSPAPRGRESRRAAPRPRCAGGSRRR